MKAVVAAFNQEKALVGAFSVITNLQMDSFEALIAPLVLHTVQQPLNHEVTSGVAHQLGLPGVHQLEGEEIKTNVRWNCTIYILTNSNI